MHRHTLVFFFFFKYVIKVFAHVSIISLSARTALKKKVIIKNVLIKQGSADTATATATATVTPLNTAMYNRA